MANRDARRPFGLTRAAPVATTPGTWPSSMSVDPVTQVGVYYGIDGGVMPLMSSGGGAHGTYDPTSIPQMTDIDGKDGPRKVPDAPRSDDTTD